MKNKYQMSNSHCRFLSNGYKINVQGNNLLWSPCCHYSEKVVLGTPEFDKEIEYTSNASDWLPECASCQNMEQHGIKLFSPTRKNSLIRIPDDAENGACVDLEISFDIKCNAACASCGPEFSSLWGATRHANNKDMARRFSFNYLTEKSDRLLQKLIDQVPMHQLRTVFILGGEPFFSDTHLKLLSHINKVHPDPSQLRVIYKTNGSIYPSDQDQKYWHLYKEVLISFSVDGAGPQFDYLRWPLKWDKVQKVIANFVDSPRDNIKLSFTNTLSPLNLLYWNELEQWVHKNVPLDKLWDPEVLVYPNRCWGIMDLALAPPAMREMAAQQQPKHSNFNLFLSVIDYDPNFKNMLAYLQRLDQRRDLDWRAVFPRAAEFLK